MKLILILTLSISFLKIHGQIMNPGFDSLTHDIDKIRLTKTDTCISIRLPNPHFNRFDSLPGIGQVVRFEIEYLIYKTGRKTFSKKYVLYDDSEKGSKLAVSNAVETNEDSIFTVLKKSFENIYIDQIYPFVYEVKNTKNHTSNYDILRTDHPSIYSIGIYNSKKYFYKTIDWDDLQEKMNSNVVNLNYKSNIATELNSIYKLLLGFIERTDKLYVFQK